MKKKKEGFGPAESNKKPPNGPQPLLKREGEKRIAGESNFFRVSKTKKGVTGGGEGKSETEAGKGKGRGVAGSPRRLKLLPARARNSH